MLHFFVPIERSARDILSNGTVSALTNVGLGCSLSELWPCKIYLAMNNSHLPFGRTIFRRTMASLFASRRLAFCQRGDVAWILSFCAPCTSKPRAESRLKMRGVHYIFHVMDDWFHFDWLRAGTINRCELADLVVVPTPQLAHRVRYYCPKAAVEILEEPIDIHRLQPVLAPNPAPVPTILWNGNPFNLDYIVSGSSALAKVSRQIHFKFRVICDMQPNRELAKHTDLEWIRFDHATEAEQIAGSWFGISPMPDTVHNRCKGAYKVKTYCAAGLPVVASPVGFQADLVREGDGVGFLPQTPDEWEQVLMRLLQDRELCIAMGKRARAYAEKRFSYTVVAPRWAEILRKHFGNSALEPRDSATAKSYLPCAG